MENNLVINKNHNNYKKIVDTNAFEKNDSIINVMKRVEIKYLLTKDQVDYLVDMIKDYMIVDKYGLTQIASLYYDTPNYRLIRESLEKQCFKEKIRLRSYGLADNNSKVYLELKRKYDGIVYKRRKEMNINDVNSFFDNKKKIIDSQIGKEITYFRDYYEKLVPSCLIIYDRVAYYQKDGDLRLTIDYNPRFRFTDLNLTKSMDGTPLLDEGSAILEIKVQESIPLWLSKILDEGKIYKNSFSKYGEAYKRKIKERI